MLTLTHHALFTCSLEKLQDELDAITSILLKNGYPSSSSSFGSIVSSNAECCCLKQVHSVIIESR